MATTAVNVLQVALLLFTLGTFVRGARAVLFRGRIDRSPFTEQLRAALAADRLDRAKAIAEECLPMWPARIALSGLLALEGRRNVHGAIEEERAAMLHAMPPGVSTLRSAARMAPPLAFIGVICELGRALSGGYGLAALQRGLPVRLALERGLVTFALGVGTCLLAISAGRVLARGVAEQLRAATEVAAVFERAVADSDRARM